MLDAAQSVTHFGPGERPQGKRFTTSLKLLDATQSPLAAPPERTNRHLYTDADSHPNQYARQCR